MIEIFVSQILVEVESLKEILEQAEIPCTVKNQQGSSLAGEVPFAEVFPELWVLNGENYPKAKELLENWQRAEPEEKTPWKCSVCGERQAGEFSACWKCGNEEHQSSQRTSMPIEYSEGDDRQNKMVSLNPFARAAAGTFILLVGLIL